MQKLVKIVINQNDVAALKENPSWIRRPYCVVRTKGNWEIARFLYLSDAVDLAIKINDNCLEIEKDYPEEKRTR